MEYVNFQTEQFKTETHFANFEQVKIDPFFSYCLEGHSCFTEFGQDIPRITSQQIQEPRIGSGRSYFNDSVWGN